jgi:hypothetical protein
MKFLITKIFLLSFMINSVYQLKRMHSKFNSHVTITLYEYDIFKENFITKVEGTINISNKQKLADSNTLTITFTLDKDNEKNRYSQILFKTNTNAQREEVDGLLQFTFTLDATLCKSDITIFYYQIGTRLYKYVILYNSITASLSFISKQLTEIAAYVPDELKTLKQYLTDQLDSLAAQQIEYQKYRLGYYEFRHLFLRLSLFTDPNHPILMNINQFLVNLINGNRLFDVLIATIPSHAITDDEHSNSLTKLIDLQKNELTGNLKKAEPNIFIKKTFRFLKEFIKHYKLDDLPAVYITKLYYMILTYNIENFNTDDKTYLLYVLMKTIFIEKKTDLTPDENRIMIESYNNKSVLIEPMSDSYFNYTVKVLACWVSKIHLYELRFKVYVNRQLLNQIEKIEEIIKGKN